MKNAQMLIAFASAALAAQTVSAAGYVYVGTHPDKTGMTQWCNWNCPQFCPTDMCKEGSGGDVTPAPSSSTPAVTPAPSSVAPTTEPTETPDASSAAPSATPVASSAAPSATPVASSVAPTTAPSATPVASSVAPTTAPSATPAPSSAAPTTAPSTTPAPSSGAPSTGGFSSYLDEAKFKELFPESIDLYTFAGLVDAAKKYPTFANTGNEVNDKRELAAFLAQTSHECDHYKAAEEYAKDKFPETQYCDPKTIPCAAGHRYHGRGPIQLSWNYNYKAAGDALGVDLLNKPELVGTDKTITWQTALWYWMTPQGGKGIIHDVVAKDDGFAQSTDIINGGLECGGPNQSNELQRIEYYKKICTKLGVEPVSKMSCNA
ncbi:hypothetical protein Poli38472_014404 [Pythium oligandrum]|uniref:Glycoside hydrolase family 19 catalytic domain-containing protein n=1 Tax=Pythium oligandrum TaxID=41045 RepID=A0A8K1C718_PYTOL|nr:hypothetical protein Poli38472_014404 [Pythium oligandrum]|eukprot:TMW57801.1 hypothetical protein Poli38472_014404 [Pythium oligandrum]